MTLPIKINLSNLQSGINSARIGLPLPKGEVLDCGVLSVYENNLQINSAITPAAFWSDGSVKWCLVKFAFRTDKSESGSVELRHGTQDVSVDFPLPPIKTIETNTTITVSETNAEFVFEKNGRSIFPKVTIGGQSISTFPNIHPVLTTIGDAECVFQNHEMKLLEHDGLSSSCVVEGTFSDNDGLNLNIKFKFEVLPGAQLNCACEIHNPKRALHPGGIWDLGDPGSVLFKDFSLRIDKHDGVMPKLKTEQDATWIDVNQPSVLFQASSGGEHWDSPVHVNAEGEVCNKFPGYALTAGSETLHKGEHATPTVVVADKNKFGYTIQLNEFWQNFPKSIDLGDSSIHFRLFPFHHGDHHELQGGERKTHNFTFQFLEVDKIDHVKNSRPTAHLSPSVYTDSGVFQYFDHEKRHTGYDRLVNVAMDPDKGFFAKREQQDEYGWRNYGEIYADHEAAFHQGDEPFISHYNNQYDPIWGFARQYALTGDDRWYQLMTDLTRHIMDIDIYRTTEDRAEYNNGLFWHTDHYVQAYTATHRTYSKKQITEDGNKPAGGGPGTQHCYSSGLVQYYYLTGDEEAKSTVYGLGDWIHNNYEGTGTVLETVKNTLREHIGKFISICRGVKVFKYIYPMDRGVGNYLRTQLDCHELSEDKKYLDQIEHVIRHTAGPSDDIDARGFDDVEYTWFYIIFLQEVIRYLDVKRELNQLDESFDYARSTLLHYARWMLEHDLPYLSQAEKLLFPNATWTAQEMRKTHVFYAAYRYAKTNRAPFLHKAKYFRDYAVGELSKADTLHYTRIQILLLQNYGPSGYLDVDSLPYPGLSGDDKIAEQENCFHSPGSHLKFLAKMWSSSLLTFKLSEEIGWLKSHTRLGEFF